MAQDLSLEVISQGFGDQSRAAVGKQVGPLPQGHLVHTGNFAGQFYHLAEGTGVHPALQQPGQNLAAEIMQDRNQVIPAPVLDQKEGGVSLPKLIAMNTHAYLIKVTAE